MDPTGVPEVCQAAHTFNLPQLITQLGVRAGLRGGEGARGWGWTAATVSATKGMQCVCICAFTTPCSAPLDSFFHSRSFPTLINTFQYLAPACQSCLSFKEGEKQQLSHKQHLLVLAMLEVAALPRLLLFSVLFPHNHAVCKPSTSSSLPCVTLAERSWEIYADSPSAQKEARGGNEGEISDHLATM